MPIIEIKAIDTLFFRDGKPFERSEDNWAEGIFPPNPSVLYGAIRSAFFAGNSEFIGKFDSNEDPTKNLQISAIWIMMQNRLLCSAPLDYSLHEDISSNGKHKISPTRLMSRHEGNFVSSLDHQSIKFKTIPFSYDEKKYVDKLFVDKSDLLQYNSEEIILAEKQDDIFVIENKIGVGLDKKTRSNRKGLVYRVGLIRLKDEFNDDELSSPSLVVAYNLDFVPSILKLGAEGKTAVCDAYHGKLSKPIDKSKTNSKFFRIVLLTPAFSKEGALINIDSLIGDGVKLELQSAYVGKPLSIGGWDIKLKEPKPMRKAIPAGSTFHYEIKSSHTYEQVSSLFSEVASISCDELSQKQGFGLFAMTPLFPNELKII